MKEERLPMCQANSEITKYTDEKKQLNQQRDYF